MSDAKKPTESKHIVDVAEPGKTAPSLTSKPVIIAQRPLMQDPMMVSKKDIDDPSLPQKPSIANSSSGRTIEPPKSSSIARQVVDDDSKEDQEHPPSSETADEVPTQLPDSDDATKATSTEDTADMDDATESSKPAPESSPQATTETALDEPETNSSLVATDTHAEDEAQIKHDAEIQKLVDSKQYFLPINATGQRRSRRFVVLGIALSLLLVLVWLDIALDAGLIQIAHVKALTHFFSN